MNIQNGQRTVYTRWTALSVRDRQGFSKDRNILSATGEDRRNMYY